ncbi:MAG: monovalent cation/H+ antiporter subunit D [Sneathiella sp.]|jgi:multicomponent K+:H+ antiporter subunit D|uniref:monovalent cation/H+ antiporter subunit D n=1 Tax=Sneathiella sp. TaxID=1964365 RepID=UPI000C60711C|nr:monovalent cation/H+ antiporter subunit D [Sneathiella sp.]MAL80271.1 monovalent cation/H+ antiporter subunit D [Sneathiella sp.]
MSTLPNHLIMAPILLPFLTGAIMLLYDDRQRQAKIGLGIVSVILQIAVAVELVSVAKEGLPVVYRLGDWLAPFGITLVLDRLSAMMLLLSSVLGLASLVYAAAAWHRQGQNYHSLFQFLLMGLHGAFLTGDLFNLFVFFEVLLAASYGLLLHGSGQTRVKAGLHYIAVNLTASLFFLIGASLVYGVTGTLNMADIARVAAVLPGGDRPLFYAAIAFLSLAFLVKAGSWPLCFWLPAAYMAGAAPVGAMFSIMTKVGVYVILRLAMLVIGAGGDAEEGIAAEIIMACGFVTIAFGMAGVLASQLLARMASFLVLVSSGTVLTVIGFALEVESAAMLTGALYYLAISTLALAALFLLSEPMNRDDGGFAAMLALTAETYGFEEEETREVSPARAMRGATTLLALSFLISLLVLAGMPPFAGFIGKVTMLGAAFEVEGFSPPVIWCFVGLLILSGFAAMIGLGRIGIQTFWGTDDPPQQVPVLEVAPILFLIFMLILLSIGAEPVVRYMAETVTVLELPDYYIDATLPTNDLDEPNVEAPQAPPSPLMKRGAP